MPNTTRETIMISLNSDLFKSTAAWNLDMALELRYQKRDNLSYN